VRVSPELNCFTKTSSQLFSLSEAGLSGVWSERSRLEFLAHKGTVVSISARDFRRIPKQPTPSGPTSIGHRDHTEYHHVRALSFYLDAPFDFLCSFSGITYSNPDYCHLVALVLLITGVFILTITTMAPLPNSKDQTLFRSVLSFYENKQYKKGLKTAEVCSECIPTCKAPPNTDLPLLLVNP
jgi:hypothetical protein